MQFTETFWQYPFVFELKKPNCIHKMGLNMSSAILFSLKYVNNNGSNHMPSSPCFTWKKNNRWDIRREDADEHLLKKLIHV